MIVKRCSLNRFELYGCRRLVSDLTRISQELSKAWGRARSCPDRGQHSVPGIPVVYRTDVTLLTLNRARSTGNTVSLDRSILVMLASQLEVCIL